MRNLICLGRTRTQIVSDDSAEALPVTAIAPLPSSETALFVAQGPTSTNSEIHISQVEVPLSPSPPIIANCQNGVITPLTSWKTSPLAPDTPETIIDLRYLNISATLCCILAGGDIVIIKVEPHLDEETFEIIGNVEGGILAAQWTLDEEILAIASGFCLPPTPHD